MEEKKEKKVGEVKKIVITIIMVILSAVIYALAFRLFINNKAIVEARGQSDLLTSGVSGIALIISRLLFTDTSDQTLLFSILYPIFNIPLFVIGFLYVGKKFTLYSLLHVMIVSVLSNALPQSFIVDLMEAGNINVETIDPLAIALFSGILTGISTGIVFKYNASGGGMDIIVLFLAIKKGINSGHYLRYINATIIIIGGLLLHQVPMIFYTLVYIFTMALIVDAIHIRNKKAVLTVITTLGEEVADALIGASRHSCTILEGKGAYSKKDKQMLHMVISSFEIDKIMSVIKSVDPNSFTSITTANIVSGRFYIPPLE